jgi:hypothetical protein
MFIFMEFFIYIFMHTLKYVFIDEYIDVNFYYTYIYRKCEPGSYCADGSRYLCSPGHWGGVYGLTAKNCSGLCSPGMSRSVYKYINVYMYVYIYVHKCIYTPMFIYAHI